MDRAVTLQGVEAGQPGFGAFLAAAQYPEAVAVVEVDSDRLAVEIDLGLGRSGGDVSGQDRACEDRGGGPDERVEELAIPGH